MYTNIYITEDIKLPMCPEQSSNVLVLTLNQNIDIQEILPTCESEENLDTNYKDN